MTDKEKRNALLDERTTLEEEINSIKTQLTQYLCGNNAMRSKDWYVSACTALNIKKSRLAKIRTDIEKVNREIKEATVKRNDERIRFINLFFYEKIQELVDKTALEQIMCELDDQLISRGLK